MADKDLTIGIKTTGADSAAREIRRVVDLKENLARSQSKSASSQPSRDLTSANEAATRSFAQLTDKVRVAEIAHYDLSAGLQKTTSATDTFTAGNTKLNAPLRNNSQALLMFSQGFEDAQYGIRGVLNNIPGLIVSLGGTAGLAGAISIAAVGLSLLYEKFGGVKEKSGEAAEKVRDAARAMGEMEGKRFEKVSEGIEAVREKVESLELKFQETNKSQAEFAIATLGNAAKIKLAEENIARALGLQIDRKKELTELAAAEGAKRNLVAQQAIDIENQRLVEAERAQQKARDILTTNQTQLETENGRLSKLREQTLELQKQEQSLKKLANYKIDRTKPLEEIDREVKKSIEAKKELKSFDYSGKIDGLTEKYRVLELAVRDMTLKVIPAAENRLNAANAAVADLSTAVATNIQKIETTLAADTLVAKSEELVTTGEQSAKDLTAALEKVEATTQTGKVAKDALVAAAADGKITANEQADVAKSLQTLMGQIQSGQALYSGNMRDLISLQKNLMRDQMQTAILMQQLKAQAQQHSTKLNQIFSRVR